MTKRYRQKREDKPVARRAKSPGEDRDNWKTIDPEFDEIGRQEFDLREELRGRGTYKE